MRWLGCLLLLTACSSLPEEPPPSHFISNELFPSSTISQGMSIDISWECKQETTFNQENIIWVVCDFHNQANHSAEIALDISIADVNHIVLDHRLIYSNLISPHTSQQRCIQLLANCRYLLCTLDAQPYYDSL